MFVPVACSLCGKPYQVPAEAVGKPAVCPWCQAAGLALPVGTPLAADAPRAAPSQPQVALLSLDDEPPSAPAATPVPIRRVWWSVAIIAGVVVLVLAALATVAYLRYKQGHIFGLEWKPFTAPDGSCSVELLGRPTEDPAAGSGEKRYVSEGWYSGTVTWVGWRDLTQREVQLAGTKDAWKDLGKVFDAERERLKSKYDGSVSKDDTIQFEDPLTREVRLATPEGAVVERMIVMHRGSRPRVYFVGMAGRIDPDGAEVKRLFDSFKASD
jgi:hypothetical protein